MQDHLRYRQQFNYESVRFVTWFMLFATGILFLIRTSEAIAAGDFMIMVPVSLVMFFSLTSFMLFSRGRLEATMTSLLVGSSLNMLIASYVFSFTAAQASWLVQAALLACAGGVYSTGKLRAAVLATLALAVAAFMLQKLGLNLNREYDLLKSEWMALLVVGLFLSLSGIQSLRSANMFSRTIADLAKSSERLSGMLSDQEVSNRRLQESDERYRLLLEHTPIALVRYDNDLRVSYSNQRLLELFGLGGLGKEAAAKLTLDMLASGGMIRVLADALQGQSGRYEGMHVNPTDGRQWWMDLSCSPVRDSDGVYAGAIAVIRDESDRRARELELSRTRDIADRASQARNRFLSLMSHEIRIPMNDVYGYAQLLMDERLPDDRRMQLKGKILKSSKALVEMVDEIVDASKMQAGIIRLDEKRFEPSMLMRQVTDQYQVAASEKNLHLYCGWQGDDPGYLMGDTQRLRQMLGNLLANAMTYTPSGFVQVVGEVVGTDAGRSALKFSVTDSGLGLSRDQQAGLFSAGDPESLDAGAGGLGLAIVKRLATLMGGDVGVISEPGNGSTFWFIVNLRLDERDPWDDGSDDEDEDGDFSPAGSLSSDSEAGGFAREPGGFGVSTDKEPVTETTAVSTNPVRNIGKNTMNILLVEDNPTNAQLVQDMLELEGFTVYHAANGQEALDALWTRKLPVEVVLMDCRMPVMDGYECTQRIRAHEQANPSAGHLPIIALTANVFEDDRNRCIQVGMDDFLRKPVDLSELVKTLRKHAA